MRDTSRKKSEVVRTSFLFPQALLEDFKEAAQARDLTMSQVLRRFMREYVAEFERDEAA